MKKVKTSTRQRIIETASDLFYHKGYNLTGINEIIREAGIAKATLYSHFKSKEAICLAYLQYKNQTFLKDIKAFIQKEEVGKAKILGLFEFLNSFFQDTAFNGCWCLNTISELPKEDVVIRQEIQHQKRGLLSYIQSLIAANLAMQDKEEQITLSRQIYLLYESAISESYLHQDNWPIETAKKSCEKILQDK